MKDIFHRTICRIFGCDLNEHLGCGRCGWYLYDGGYDGPCGAIQFVKYETRRLYRVVAGKRCVECKARFWGKDVVCSKRCLETWQEIIPF